LIAGGTLAACAAAGVRTAVICLTRGERGPISDPVLATRETLADVRVAELGAACAELGIDRVECFAWQDGNLRASDRTQIVAQLAEAIQMEQPRAVITFGPDGLYFHPDHVTTYELARLAIEVVPTPPTLYRAVWPEGLMSEMVRALGERGLPNNLWDIQPESFVLGVDRRGELAIDVSRFASRKLAALRCHRTQLSHDHAFTALPEDLAERFLGTERFVRVSPGDDDGWLTAVAAGAER
jgi:LmbE family N-acetylglucosaminyl deacetylase